MNISIFHVDSVNNKMIIRHTPCANFTNRQHSLVHWIPIFLRWWLPIWQLGYPCAPSQLNWINRHHAGVWSNLVGIPQCLMLYPQDCGPWIAVQQQQ